ncbi:hypothetical protein [Rhizobium sp. MHM7A]|uniref:hypothetical protein n=1 Tax=Rhizobium sp. MHM7A TaxID=2583233 RepID=UPI0011074C80|nr:hypothetical protein [Rhizobium sp. MHM7A]TLX17174.1 hypothetical protein FFR93_07645 [Rhizobium sp. MHM7A]
MSKLVLPAVDAARAKILARAVQRRHQELGTTVSLNHAYEVVATVCGFETWSRMKSRLHECDVEGEEPAKLARGNPERVLAESTLSFEDFVPHDVTPSVVVSGPDGAVKTKILTELISKWRHNHGSQARVRLVTKRPKPHYIEQLRGVLASGNRGGIDANLEVLRIRSMGRIRLNPFDTPLGERQPNSAHRARLVDLISVIINEEAWETPGVKSLAGLLIDMAYDAVSDRTRDGKPNLFVRGTDKKIDGKVFGNDGVATWWDVAEELSLRGDRDLAVQAQAYAVPKLDIMMRLLRSDQVDSTFGSAMALNGETLVNQAARRIASAIRECVSLQSPSNTTIDPNIRSIIIDLDDDDEAGFFGKLTSRIFSDLCFSFESLFGQSTSKERTLIVLDGLDDASCQNFLINIDPVLKGPESKKLHMIASTRSAQQAERHSDASSFLLHGFESRAEVNDFRKMIEFGDDAFENAHNFLFDPEQPQSVALGVRRGFRTVADGMVAIP